MFRTELNPSRADFSIALQDPLLTVGSCFSDVIGQRLLDHKFETMVNPFGTIFHPGIACQLLEMALDDKVPSADTFIQLDGRWVSSLLHSSIHAPDPAALEERLTVLFRKVKEQLLKAKVLMLTAGTAFLYIHEASGLGVANCHKQPQKLYRKHLSSLDELNTSFASFHQKLSKENPHIRLILTVSPVRHLKDTLELNTVSKATLRLAIHQWCSQFKQLSYFPSYELLLDDLRDYRFYGRDMLHPSQEAEDYVWHKFSDTYFGEQTLQFTKEWQGIRSALAHKPFNPESAAHQQFIRKTIQKLEGLTYQVDVQSEIASLKSQLL
jgi:hypothetical protein